MENEKVKEIKEALECLSGHKSCNLCSYHELAEMQETCCINVVAEEVIDYINELESENERWSKEKEDLRLFYIALGNGKVDMTLGGNTAKSFINAIVQIFEQNNATNFLATTIETVSSGNKYSLVIQKENGQTPSEKLTELKDRIAELEKENKENNSYAKGYADGIKNTYEVVVPDKLKQFAERLKDMPFDIEFTFKESSYEDIKKLANLMKEYSVKYIDETLKECIND